MTRAGEYYLEHGHLEPRPVTDLKTGDDAVETPIRLARAVSAHLSIRTRRNVTCYAACGPTSTADGRQAFKPRGTGDFHAL